MTPLRPTQLTVVALVAALLLSGCALLPSFPGADSGGSPDGPSETSSDSTSDDASEDGDLDDNPFIEQSVPDTNSKPAGRVSVIDTPVADDGPSLLAVSR